MNDGSIRIKVKIDNDVAEKDLSRLNRSIERTAQNIEKAMSKLSDNPTAGLSKSGDVLTQIDQQATSATATIAEMRAKLAEVGNQTVQTEQLESVYKEIAKADKKMEELIARQNKMDAMGVKDTSKQYKSLQYEIDATAEKLDKLRAREEDLITRGVGTVRIGDTQEFADKVAQVDALEAKQQSLNEKTDEYRAKVKAVVDAKGFKGFDGVLDKMGNSFSGLTKKVIKYGAALLGARGAMGILRKAVNSYMQANEETHQAVTSAWAAIGEMLGPVIEWLVGLITTAISWINMFVYALTGINFVARANAKALNKQAAATNNAAKAQRQLAGFDEQNRLGDNVSESGGGVGGGGGFAVDDTIKNGIEEQLAKISAIVGISTLALGAILAFTGVNIPLGISLMAIGALELAAATKIAWGLDSDIRNSISKIEAILGVALLAVGAVLAFSGVNVSLGIALMAIGAVSFATAVALSWGEIEGKIKGSLTAIEAIAGGFLVALGVILLMTGNIPLGLGALVAGGASLITAINPDFSGILDTIEGFFKDVKNKVDDKIEQIKEKFNNLPEKFKLVGFAKWRNDVVDKFEGLRTRINDRLDKVKDKIQNWPSKFKIVGFNQWRNDVVDKFEGLRTRINERLDKVKDKINNLASKFKLGGFTEFRNKVASVFDGMGTKIGNAISGAIKSALNKIISTAESKINSAINLINNAIDLANKLPGVNVGHVKTVSFPRLAKGGIVNNPGRGVPAVVGEAGAEAILPLDRNTEWMDMLADKIIARASSGEDRQPIVFQVSGRKIAEIVVDINKKRTFATNGGMA